MCAGVAPTSPNNHVWQPRTSSSLCCLVCTTTHNLADTSITTHCLLRKGNHSAHDNRLDPISLPAAVCHPRTHTFCCACTAATLRGPRTSPTVSTNATMVALSSNTFGASKCRQPGNQATVLVCMPEHNTCPTRTTATSNITDDNQHQTSVGVFTNTWRLGGDTCVQGWVPVPPSAAPQTCKQACTLNTLRHGHRHHRGGAIHRNHT